MQGCPMVGHSSVKSVGSGAVHPTNEAGGQLNVGGVGGGGVGVGGVGVGGGGVGGVGVGGGFCGRGCNLFIV